MEFWLFFETLPTNQKKCIKGYSKIFWKNLDTFPLSKPMCMVKWWIVVEKSWPFAFFPGHVYYNFSYKKFAFLIIFLMMFSNFENLVFVLFVFIFLESKMIVFQNDSDENFETEVRKKSHLEKSLLMKFYYEEKNCKNKIK